MIFALISVNKKKELFLWTKRKFKTHLKIRKLQHFSLFLVFLNEEFKKIIFISYFYCERLKPSMKNYLKTINQVDNCIEGQQLFMYWNYSIIIIKVLPIFAIMW